MAVLYVAEVDINKRDIFTDRRLPHGGYSIPGAPKLTGVYHNVTLPGSASPTVTSAIASDFVQIFCDADAIWGWATSAGATIATAAASFVQSGAPTQILEVPTPGTSRIVVRTG